MKIGLANYNWLSEGQIRLDSSYHLSEGHLYRKTLQNCPWGIDKLKDVSKDIFYGGRSKRHYVDNEKTGVPFMGSADMLKGDFSSLKFISKSLTKNMNAFLLENGWTLISRSGTIGNTAYASEVFKGKAASEHIIRVIPNDKILPGYLYSFLSSKYGYSLMTQGTFGAVIQHIEPEYLSSLPIPKFSKEKQLEIHELAESFSKLRFEASELLQNADEKFINLLNIDDKLYSKISHPAESRTSTSFLVSRAQIDSISIRARSYSSRLNEIRQLFEKSKHEKLIDLLVYPAIKGGRYKRVETSSTSPNAVELLNQGDLHNRMPKGKTISKKYIDNLEAQTAQRNMIIVPAVGTLGENEIFSRPLFVYGYLEGKVLSEHLLRIMPDHEKIPPGYLFTVLKSKLFFRVFRSLVYGTNLLYYILPLLHDFPIPRFSEDNELEIDEMVKEAYSKLTLANNNEANAIELVENEIESWQKS